MDQHREAPASHGWRKADKTQLQDGLDELHKTLDRLNALQTEYQELVDNARQGLQNLKENQQTR